MTNLYAAHREWATRPADERFDGFGPLLEFLKHQKETSFEEEGPYKELRMISAENEDVMLMRGDEPVKFTHHSFAQLASNIGAPPEYLRELPARFVVPLVNHGLKQIVKQGKEQAQMLIQRNGNGSELRALNSNYSRIWSYDVAKSVSRLLDFGWMIPPARPSVNDPRARPATAADILPNQGDFGLSVKEGDLIAPSGLNAGDRNMFLFPVLPTRTIDDGGKGMMRGMFIENSEVGAGRLKATCFLMEHVCGNHIVWNAKEVFSISQVHRGSMFKLMNAQRDMIDSMKKYAESSESKEMGLINKARAYILGADREEAIECVLELDHKVKHRLNKTQLNASYDLAIEYETDAQCPPTHLWGLSHGLTRLSQQESNADNRTRLDIAAGKLLAIASRTR